MLAVFSSILTWRELARASDGLTLDVTALRKHIQTGQAACASEEKYDGAKPCGTPKIYNALVLVDEVAILLINGRIREKFGGPNKLFELHISFK